MLAPLYTALLHTTAFATNVLISVSYSLTKMCCTNYLWRHVPTSSCEHLVGHECAASSSECSPCLTHLNTVTGKSKPCLLPYTVTLQHTAHVCIRLKAKIVCFLLLNLSMCQRGEKGQSRPGRALALAICCTFGSGCDNSRSWSLFSTSMSRLQQYPHALQLSSASKVLLCVYTQGTTYIAMFIAPVPSYCRLSCVAVILFGYIASKGRMTYE